MVPRLAALVLRLVAVLETARAEEFASFVAASSACSANSISVSARSNIECAVKCSQTSSSLSYSFINGICVLSDRADCASSGAAIAFTKRMDQEYTQSATTQGSTTTGGPITMPIICPGYQQQIGGRTFWVFQQRQTGQVAFNRNWNDYVNGFGNATEFWVGLENIHNFTTTHISNLRIEVVTVDEVFYVFEWLGFAVGSSVENYKMSCGSLLAANSTINCDFLSTARDQKFSTSDIDNDMYLGNCATNYGSGGYWWNSCMNSNPNGMYSPTLITTTSKSSYMATACIGSYTTLRAMRMMLQV